MSVAVNVTVDQSVLDKALEQLQGRALRRAATNAINNTARQANTNVSRMLAKASGAKVGRVKRSMGFRRAREGELVATISVSGKSLPLIEFKARQTRRGVSANAWGKRKLYEGTFIATMSSGHRGVFSRSSDARLPIKEKFGPSFPKIFGSENVKAEFRRTTAERLGPNLEREVDRALRRQAGLVKPR